MRYALPVGVMSAMIAVSAVVASPLPPQSICHITGEVIEAEITDKWIAGWNDHGEFVEEFTKSTPFTQVKIRLQSREIAEKAMADSCHMVDAAKEIVETYQLCTDAELKSGQKIVAKTQLSGDEFAMNNCLISVEVMGGD